MADGIAIEVEGGFARIEFLDRTKRGDALAALLRVGGPAMIDVDTRSGPRKVYVVPESIAIEAGLIAPPAPKRAARKAAAKDSTTTTD